MALLLRGNGPSASFGSGGGGGSTPDILDHEGFASSSVTLGPGNAWSITNTDFSGFRDTAHAVPSIVSDGGVPSGKALQIQWTGGAFEPYCMPILGVNNQVLWVEFLCWLDADYDNGGIQKFIRYRGPGGDPPLGTITIHQNKWNFVSDGYGGDSGNNHFAINQPTHGPDTLHGTWKRIKMMIDLSTANHMKAKFYVDNTKVIDQDLTVSHAATNIREFWIWSTFNEPANNDACRVSDVSVGTSDFNP